MATITAVLASLSTASAAAMLPRSSPAGFFWTFQPEPLDTSFAPLQNGVIQAVNGKFWIGGNYAKSAVLICGANDGSVTNCALVNSPCAVFSPPKPPLTTASSPPHPATNQSTSPRTVASATWPPTRPSHRATTPTSGATAAPSRTRRLQPQAQLSS